MPVSVKSMDITKSGVVLPSPNSRSTIIENPKVTEDNVTTSLEPAAAATAHSGQSVAPSKGASERVSEAKQEEPASDDIEQVDTKDSAEYKNVTTDQENEERERVQKLIDDKKYFVKIQQSSSSSLGSAVLVILLAIFVSMVGLNLLADANIITLPIQPITNIL